MTNTDRFLYIDEEGFFVFDGGRLEDEDVGRSLLSKLKPAEKDRFTSEMDGVTAWVEYFDEPFVVRHAERSGAECKLVMPYGHGEKLDLSSLCLDEWDRFHGRVTSGIPFVFSRSAQFEFFNLVDDYDDESVTVDGKRYVLPPWLEERSEVNTGDFWTDIYQNETPGWEMNAPHPALQSILPQLKLPKSRILVLGCGSGNDAAFLAGAGHVVTAVDLSSEALAQAAAKYSSSGVKWVQADAFSLPESMAGQFDLIFEHTLYCAVTPSRRGELVEVWRRALHSQGQVLAILFAMDKRLGPPWGGSEWEIRQRLAKKFQFLYWTRWHHSHPGRQSKELVVLGRKI